MTTRSRRFLLALTFLLLALMGAIKWRADHPPLSKMDRLFRSEVDKATAAHIGGSGLEWESIGGPDANGILIIHDQALLYALTETLRCDEQPLSVHDVMPSQVEIGISLAIPTGVTPKSYKWVSFDYVRGIGAGGLRMACVVLNGGGPNGSDVCANVRPEFESSFEYLIAQCVQRANAKGEHPDVTWDDSPVV